MKIQNLKLLRKIDPLKMKLTLIQIKLGVTVVQASLYSMGIMNLTPWEALDNLQSTTHARFLTDDEINEERSVSYYMSKKTENSFILDGVSF